jgi:hypothetical protein
MLAVAFFSEIAGAIFPRSPEQFFRDRRSLRFVFVFINRPISVRGKRSIVLPQKAQQFAGNHSTKFITSVKVLLWR